MKFIKHIIFALFFTLVAIAGIFGYSYYSHHKQLKNFIESFSDKAKVKYKSKTVTLTQGVLNDVEIIPIMPKNNRNNRNRSFNPLSFPNQKIKFKKIIVKSFSINPINIAVIYQDLNVEGVFNLKKFLSKFFGVNTIISLEEYQKGNKNISQKIIFNAEKIIKLIFNTKKEIHIENKITYSNLMESLQQSVIKEIEGECFLDKAATSAIKRIPKKNIDGIISQLEQTKATAKNQKVKKNTEYIIKLLKYIESKAYRLESKPAHFKIIYRNINWDLSSFGKKAFNPQKISQKALSGNMEIITY